MVKLMNNFSRRTMTSDGTKSQLFDKSLENVSRIAPIVGLLCSIFVYAESRFDKVDGKFTNITDKLKDEIIKIKDAEKEASVKRAEDRKWWK
jgi:hypothetical protein